MRLYRARIVPGFSSRLWRPHRTFALEVKDFVNVQLTAPKSGNKADVAIQTRHIYHDAKISGRYQSTCHRLWIL